VTPAEANNGPDTEMKDPHGRAAPAVMLVRTPMCAGANVTVTGCHPGTGTGMMAPTYKKGAGSAVTFTDTVTSKSLQENTSTTTAAVQARSMSFVSTHNAASAEPVSLTNANALVVAPESAVRTALLVYISTDVTVIPVITKAGEGVGVMEEVTLGVTVTLEVTVTVAVADVVPVAV
jgi:hypothetical protein